MEYKALYSIKHKNQTLDLNNGFMLESDTEDLKQFVKKDKKRLLKRLKKPYMIYGLA